MRALPQCCTTSWLHPFLHPLPSLIKNCLNLPFGTQGSSSRLNETYILQTRNQGHKSPFLTFLTAWDWEFIWYSSSPVCGLSARWLYGGVNGDFPIGLMPHAVWPRSATHRAPAPVAGHCSSLPPQETLNTQRQVWLSLCEVSGSWCTQNLFEPSECFWWLWGLILNMILPLLLSCWGFSFALGHEVSFFGGIQHSFVDGCSAVNCNFGVLTGEDERTSF